LIENFHMKQCYDDAVTRSSMTVIECHNVPASLGIGWGSQGCCRAWT